MTKITEAFINNIKEKISQPISLPFGVLNVDPVEDSELFVGHDQELEELGKKIIPNCLSGTYRKMALYGIKGSGKTSVVSIIKEASIETDLTYKVIGLDKRIYLHDYNACYISIVREIYSHVWALHQLEGSEREYETVKAQEKIRDFAKNLHSKKTTKELLDDAKGLGIFNSDPNSKMSDEIKFIYDSLKQLKEQKILLILDDFEILQKPESIVTLQKLKDIMSLDGIIPVMVMHTETFNKLNQQQDEILKDCSSIEILPLTVPELKELLIRRMFYFSGKEIPPDPLSHSTEMFSMFKGKTLDIIGEASRGNPLNFINFLKDTIALANEENEKSLNEEMAESVIFESIAVPENLSIIQKQVFELVKEKGKVTIEDVRKFHGKSRIAAFFILKGLYELGLLDKKREGREVKYFIKTS